MAKERFILQSAVSKAEDALIRAAAKAKGVSVSEYVRTIVVPVASDT